MAVCLVRFSVTCARGCMCNHELLRKRSEVSVALGCGGLATHRVANAMFIAGLFSTERVDSNVAEIGF